MSDNTETKNTPITTNSLQEAIDKKAKHEFQVRRIEFANDFLKILQKLTYRTISKDSVRSVLESLINIDDLKEYIEHTDSNEQLIAESLRLLRYNYHDSEILIRINAERITSEIINAKEAFDEKIEEVYDNIPQ